MNSEYVQLEVEARNLSICHFLADFPQNENLINEELTSLRSTRPFTRL